MDNTEKRGGLLKKGRVGTLTMAVVLILSGILMLVSRSTGVPAVEYFIKFWPITLFLLGGEVLYNYFKYRGRKDIKIGYDLISIGIIIIILVVNIGLYGLSSLKFLDRIKSVVSQEDKNYILENKTYKVSSGIEKIVLEDIEDINLTMRTGGGDSLDVRGNLAIKSYDREGLEDFVNKDLVAVEESGKVLYLKIRKKDSQQFGKEELKGELDLTIPRGRMVEVTNVSNVNLELDRLDEDLVINDTNQVTININRETPYNILAQIGNRDKFLGGEDWKIEEVKNEEGDRVYYLGRIKDGESDHTIKIMNGRSVRINKK